MGIRRTREGVKRQLGDTSSWNIRIMPGERGREGRKGENELKQEGRERRKVEKIKKRLWERNISGEKGVELEGGRRKRGRERGRDEKEGEC